MTTTQAVAPPPVASPGMSPRVFSPTRLVDARRSRGLLQAEVATLIGRTARHYRRFEYGEADPSARMLGVLSAALGVAIDDLYGPPNK